MIRGLYTSAWSMLANSKMMDVISNNMANVNTNGYKKDAVVFESFPSVLTKRINDSRSPSNPSGDVGEMQLGNDIGEIFTYYKQGQLLETGNKFDFAIQGDDSAFFNIGLPDDQGNMKQYYTRNGGFSLNADSQIVTKEGYLVMGQDGPITLSGEDFSIQDDGTIIQNGEAIDKFKITSFSDVKELRKFGDGLVEPIDGAEELEFGGVIAQSNLEQSNVNIIKEMVDMISVMRAYETNQKVVQALDSTLEKVVNEVGAIR